MKVSVIVTAYNKENYIRKCLESVINQDCNDWELIIVEDGSTDNTKEVIEQFVMPYLENIIYKDRIKLVLNSENKGLNAARNTGLENVSCEFFTFLDGDDYYEPNAISTLLNAYYKTNADLVIGEFTNVDEKTGERDRRSIFDKSFVITENATKKMTKVAFFNQSMNKQRLVNTVAKIFKTAIVKENNLFFNPKVRDFDDMYFNLEYYRHIKTVVYIHKHIYNRRWHMQSMVNQFRPNIYKEMSNSLKEYKRLREKYNFNPELEKHLAFHMIVILLKNGIEDNKNPEKTLKEKIDKFYRFLNREPLREMWNCFTVKDGNTFGTKLKVWAIKNHKLYQYYKLKDFKNKI